MNITIPDEALKAACRAFTEIMLDVAPDGAIEAACLAMLKHWPGMEVEDRYFMFRGADSRIILPLPQETNE